MARFYGVVGYAIPKETRPGYWEDEIIERTYSGDVLRDMSMLSSNPDSTNDELRINNQFSVVADPFAYQNFHSIRYVEFMGTKWKVTNIDPRFPRLLLTAGGVYNGQ
jgi:hypothetical protein